MKKPISDIWAEADRRPSGDTYVWEYHAPEYNPQTDRPTDETWRREFTFPHAPAFSLVFELTYTSPFGEWFLSYAGQNDCVYLDLSSTWLTRGSDLKTAMRRADALIYNFFHKAAEEVQPLPF